LRPSARPAHGRFPRPLIRVQQSLFADPKRRSLIALGIVAVSAWMVLNALLLWLYYEPALKPLVGDEFDYNRRALALLAGAPVPETFIWPPGQTWFIATIYRVFGSHVLAVQAVQMGLLAVCALLLVRLWSPLGGRTAAMAGALLFLLNPSNLAHAHWLWPEVTHLVCLLGALVLLRGRNPRTRLVRGFGAGLLIGLALLFKSLLGAFWPLLLLLLLQRVHGRLVFAWSAALAFVVGMVLATSPALWHGYVETGRPMIADSSIYNLHVGLRDTSRSDYIDEAGGPALKAFIDSAATPSKRNAIYLDKVRATVAGRGIVEVVGERLGIQYFRLFNAKTLLVSQLPGPACAGRLGAYAATPLTPWLVGASHLGHAATLVLAAFAIALWRRWREPLALIVAALLLYQLALYLGLHVMQRYLFQMLPFLCAFAGSTMVLLLQPRNEADALAVTPKRLAVGSMLAATLLALAFLGPWLDRACASG
ncbi:MAG: glycosyltransferase family 39 protein, partial [Dokdonella sp.]